MFRVLCRALTQIKIRFQHVLKSFDSFRLIIVGWVSPLLVFSPTTYVVLLEVGVFGSGLYGTPNCKPTNHYSITLLLTGRTVSRTSVGRPTFHVVLKLRFAKFNKQVQYLFHMVFIKIDHPINAKFVNKHSKVGPPKGFLHRHSNLSACGKPVK